MKRPETTEYPPFFQHYIDLVKSDNIVKVLDNQVMKVQEFISDIPEEKENYVYAPGKWTIKEIIGHMIDTERIMVYRTLRIARKDKTKLAGFDENKFVLNANFNKRTFYELAHEFGIVRESTILLVKHLDDDVLKEMGYANKYDVSVRAILFMIAGHTIHHLNVIKTKYLKD